MLDVDEALKKLEVVEPRKAGLDRLPYFAGLTLTEAARALVVSGSNADNDRSYVKAWLRVDVEKLVRFEKNP